MNSKNKNQTDSEEYSLTAVNLIIDALFELMKEHSYEKNFYYGDCP